MTRFYKECGWFNKRIIEENTSQSFMEWLTTTYTPTRVPKGSNVLNGEVEKMLERKPYLPKEIAEYYSKMEGAKPKQWYFMHGIMIKDENNKLRRNTDSIVSRSSITLDYDDPKTPTLDVFVERVKEAIPEVECYIYPTIKYTDEFPRWRLVLETDRPLLEYEYKTVAKDLAEKIGFIYDESVISDWQKFAGLPVITPKNAHVAPVYIEGSKLTTPNPKEMKPPVKKSPKIVGTYASQFNTGGTIPYDDAIEIMKRFIQVYESDLMEYDFSIKKIAVIAKAVSSGEIDYNTGLECVELLAMGNTEWKQGNIYKFHHLLARNIFTTKFTFWYAFKIQVDNVTKPCDTLEELYRRLEEKGQEWRDAHEEIKRDGTVKIHLVPPRVVADFIKQLCYCGRLGGYDADTRYLAIYNPDRGIYEVSENFRKKIIRTIERGMKKSECNEVLDFLTHEPSMKELERTDKMQYVITHNGLYDLYTKRLEPFTHEIVFESTISVDYNPNAIEPVFPDGWTLSKWFNDIAEGDPDKIELLWQIVASVVHSNLPSGLVAMLFSSLGQTGKSTFEQLLKNIAGQENTASLLLKEFENRFDPFTAVGKSLIIGDDNNPRTYNAESQGLKRIVTGEPMGVESKGINKQTYQFNCQVVQSMNGLPTFGDVTDGLTRRLRIIEFKKAFKGAENNPRVKTQYIKDPRLLEWVVKESMNHIVLEGEWVKTAEHESYIKDIVLDSDPVARYVDTRIPKFSSTRLPLSFMYLDFKATYQSENGRASQLGQRNFTKQLRQYMESQGWTYSKNNYKPLEAFHKADYQMYLDTGTAFKLDGYNYEKESVRTQPLLIKEQSTNLSTLNQL